MNTVPFYILGIALGFASGILVMLSRERARSGDLASDYKSSQALQPRTEDSQPETLFIEAPLEEYMLLTEELSTDIPADEWLEEIHSEELLKPRHILTDTSASDDLAVNPDILPEGALAHYSENDSWVDELKKSHEELSQASNREPSTLPLVFDSFDPQNSK